jgi:hypothetical protein
VTRMSINYTARASERLIEYYTDESKEGGMRVLCSARRIRKFIKILIGNVNWMRRIWRNRISWVYNIKCSLQILDEGTY